VFPALGANKLTIAGLKALNALGVLGFFCLPPDLFGKARPSPSWFPLFSRFFPFD
jgi:hypothetical protein